MKLFLGIFLFIFIYFKSEVRAQQYNIFPLVDSASWRMYYGCGEAFVCSEDLLYDYTIHGDTIILGKLYKKLFISNTKLYIHHFGSQNCCSIYPSNGYIGAIRQDTILRKVYIIRPSFNNDSLLYDFTLNVGDTLKSSLLSNSYICDTLELIVTEIDSVLIGSTFHKKWIFNCYLDYIEGIGSSFSLFGNSYQEDLVGLVCLKYNNIPIYSTGAFSWTCDIPLLINNPYIKESTISCNNLVTDLLIIHFDQNNIKTDQLLISVSNQLGEIILQEKVSQKLSELQLNLNWLVPGIYFLKIESPDKTNYFVSKLIKK